MYVVFPDKPVIIADVPGVVGSATLLVVKIVPLPAAGAVPLVDAKVGVPVE